MRLTNKVLILAFAIIILMIISIIAYSSARDYFSPKNDLMVDLFECQRCDDKGCTGAPEYKSLTISEQQVILVTDQANDGTEIYKYPSGENGYCNVIKGRNFMFECTSNDVYPGGISSVSLNYDGNSKFFYQAKMETYVKKYIDYKVNCKVKK